VNLSFSVFLIAIIGQTPPPSPEKPEDSEARLNYMKKSVTIYSVHSANDPATVYRLQTEPILRYSNPVGLSRDGGIFLRLGQQDRSEAVVQVSVIRSGHWDHQFSSLSTRPLIAETRAGAVWTLRQAGTESDDRSAGGQARAGVALRLRPDHGVRPQGFPQGTRRVDVHDVGEPLWDDRDDRQYSP
jgi:hypothetical protein